MCTGELSNILKAPNCCAQLLIADIPYVMVISLALGKPSPYIDHSAACVSHTSPPRPASMSQYGHARVLSHDIKVRGQTVQTEERKHTNTRTDGWTLPNIFSPSFAVNNQDLLTLSKDGGPFQKKVFLMFWAKMKELESRA